MKNRLIPSLFYSGIGFCFLLIGSNVFALIGENLEQSKERYGPPIKSDGEWQTYRKNDLDLQLRIHFDDGLADEIIYKKNKDPKSGLVDNLTFGEMAVFMDNNSNGAKWSGLIDGFDETKIPKTMWNCKKWGLGSFYDDESKELHVFVQNHSQGQVAMSEAVNTSDGKDVVMTVTSATRSEGNDSVSLPATAKGSNWRNLHRQRKKPSHPLIEFVGL